MRDWPLTVLLRDLVLLGATLGLWAWERQASTPPLALSIAAGAMTALAAYLFHEWGHLLGARLSGARIEVARTPLTALLFRFDVVRNDRRQFLWMSVGGFVASGLVVALLLSALSFTRLADRIALALALLGVLATAVLELPVAWRIWRGAPMPRGAAYVGTPPAD